MCIGLASFYWPPPGGGAERYVQRLAWALGERGCDVRWFARLLADRRAQQPKTRERRELDRFISFLSTVPGP